MFTISRKLLRSALLTAVCQFGLALIPATASAQGFDPVLAQLVSVQDENLKIAREIAQIEVKAAAALESGIATGAISEPGQVSVARTLAANAMTIATALLAPIQSGQAHGDGAIMMIQRNLALTRTIAPFAAGNPAFSAEVARYVLAQTAAQEMAATLQAGWARYGEVLREAESSGVLSANGYDPNRQDWTLSVPDPSAPLQATPPATSVAAIESPPSPQPEPTPAAAPEPERPVVAAPPPSPVPVPEPSLTGQPQSPLEAETVDENYIPPMVLALPQDEPEPDPKPALPATEERLAPGGPPDVAFTPAFETGPVGDWTLSTSPETGPLATGANLNPETLATIGALEIVCGPDETISFRILSEQSFSGFRVYSDQLQSQAVGAEQNVIGGDDAATMAETLLAAQNWAQQVPDSSRRMTLRAGDSAGPLALFSASGFVEAHDRMVAACRTAPAAAAVAPQLSPLPVGEPTPVATTPAPEPLATEPDAAVAPDTAVEPTPTTATPRPAAPARTPPPVPMPRMQRPLNILNGG